MVTSSHIRVSSVPALLGLLLMLSAGPVTAQGTASDSVKRSTISEIDFIADNTGIFGHDPAGGGYGFLLPRGSSNTYLFGSGLWFGAKKRSADLRPLVFYTYNPATGKSQATPGEAGDTGAAARPDLYHSVDHDRTDGRYIGDLPSGAPNWPLWWFDFSTEASILDPGRFIAQNVKRTNQEGDRVPSFAFNASEQMICRYHDMNLKRYEIDSALARELGYPLGLQIEQNIFAWNTAQLGRAVVIQYKVRNISSDTLYECVMAHASDPDIGTLDNDRIGFLESMPDLRTGYVYTEPEKDGDYGILAISVIEAPVTESSGRVDISNRRKYPAIGRVAAFPQWIVGSDSEPVTHLDRYEMMYNGGFVVDTASADHRALIACTPFNMYPGDVAYFAVSYMVVSTPLDGLELELQFRVNALINEYYRVAPVTSQVVDSWKSDSHVSVAPNPVSSTASVTYTVAERSPVRIRLVDELGQTVWHHDAGERDAGTYHQVIDGRGLAPGAYLVVIESRKEIATTRLVLVR
jgi:hypothetical protein